MTKLKTQQDYLLQVVALELEAQNENNNLVQIDLSLEAQAVLAYSHRVYNRDKILAKLKRANPHITKQKHKKSFLLCSQAQKLFKTVIHKLQTQERVLLNSKYISKITECDSTDQNKRIMDQLDYVLKIEYHRLAIVDGTPYNYHYSFELHPTIIEELKDAGLWNLKSIPAELRVSYNNIPNTSIRSIRSRANFANAKNSNYETSNTELEETQKLVAKGKCGSSISNQPTTETAETIQEAQAVEESSPIPAPVTQLQFKSPRPANKRKTKTCEQQKQRKVTNVVRNGFLGGGKRLSEIQPYLTDEFCEKLRSACGREFTNQAIRQITKAIAVSEKGQHAEFKHVNGILSYLTPALANEKRDAVKTSGEHYYTLAGMTAEDKLWQQQEQYLEETEQISIKQPCSEHQFRAKLANTLERSTAYNLLLAMQTTLEVGNTLVISLNRQIELTDRQKQVILSQAQAVFNSGGISEDNQTIEKIQFMTDNRRFLRAIKKENKNQVSAVYNKVCSGSSNPVFSSVYKDIENKSESAETHGLELPKSNWGKVMCCFYL